jgi:16S rRNA (uracil1498-N3)-methyltransferase
LVKKGANTLILIGPEGDFSKEEINFALQNGFKAISLGRERLRTETAAVVATTVVATINKL